MQFKQYLNENFQLDSHVIHLYFNSPSIAEVQKQTNISYGQLYRILEKNGIKPYRRQKSTSNLVQKYHSDGMSIPEIAKLTGYTIRNVRNILNANI